VEIISLVSFIRSGIKLQSLTRLGCSGALRHPQAVQLNIEDRTRYEYADQMALGGARYDETSKLRKSIRQAAFKLREWVPHLISL